MRSRLTALALAACALALLVAGSAAAAMVGIYRNTLDSSAQNGQIGKLSGERCGRGGSTSAFKVVVGKRTKECAYKTPVVGRDLEISVRGLLLNATPPPIQRKAFLAASLRTGGAGAGYQLAVFPLQRKAQLRKVLSDGSVKYLAIEKDLRAVKGTQRAVDLRLRAINVGSGPDKGKCRIVAYVGNTLVGDVIDDGAGELQGRASGFSVGAVGNGKGATASFDDVVIRVPVPL